MWYELTKEEYDRLLKIWSHNRIYVEDKEEDFFKEVSATYFCCDSYLMTSENIDLKNKRTIDFENIEVSTGTLNINDLEEFSHKLFRNLYKKVPDEIPFEIISFFHTAYISKLVDAEKNLVKKFNEEKNEQR